MKTRNNFDILNPKRPSSRADILPKLDSSKKKKKKKKVKQEAPELMESEILRRKMRLVKKIRSSLNLSSSKNLIVLRDYNASKRLKLSFRFFFKRLFRLACFFSRRINTNCWSRSISMFLPWCIS